MFEKLKDREGQTDYDLLDELSTGLAEELKEVRENMDFCKLLYAVKQLEPVSYTELHELFGLPKATLHDKIEGLERKGKIMPMSLTHKEAEHKRQLLKRYTGQLHRKFWVLGQTVNIDWFENFTRPVPKRFRSLVSSRKEELESLSERYIIEQKNKARILRERKEKSHPPIVRIRDILAQDFIGKRVDIETIVGIGYSLNMSIGEVRARKFLTILQKDKNSILSQTENGVVVKSPEVTKEKEAREEVDRAIDNLLGKAGQQDKPAEASKELEELQE